MKLSVVVPIFNAADTLARCVDSICSQSFSDWETILVDDGSTDSCPALCDAYSKRDPRIRVIHKQNGGLSDARNHGIETAQGEWLTFIDADDYINPDTFERLLYAADSEPDVEIIEYPVICHEGGSNCHTITFDNRIYPDSRSYWIDTDAHLHTYAWNKMYRRYLMNNIRFPIGRNFEDMWTTPRILQQEPIIMTIGNGLYHYTCNPNGITMTATGSDWKNLLEASIAASKILNISLLDDDASHWYMNALNLQIEVYRQCHIPPILPSRTLPLSAATSFKEKIKILILNTLGMTSLCKIMTIAGKRF